MLHPLLHIVGVCTIVVYLRNIARAMIKDQGPVIECCHCVLCSFCSLYFIESKVCMVALNIHTADITIRLKLKRLGSHLGV